MLVLASASPRRRELMALLGVPFEVMPSRYAEPNPPQSPVGLPGLVTDLAIAKAVEVAERVQDCERTIIGADTLVTLSHSDSGVPLGKPVDEQDAARMLRMLSGTTHFVYTGVALAGYRHGSVHVDASSSVRTAVTFRELSSDMIEDYVRTGEPMDKAGAYGAQGYASPFITSFDGDYFNVVGLPVSALAIMLESCGIEWWRHRCVMPPVIG
jgi:septum formation protein